MKKISAIILCIFLICIVNVSAQDKNGFHTFVYDQDENAVLGIDVEIKDLNWGDNEEYTMLLEDDDNENYNIPHEVYYDFEPREQVIIMDFKTDDEENPYPPIESMDVSATVSQNSIEENGNETTLGKNYRIIYLNSGMSEDVSEAITESDISSVNFRIDRLGMYAIYFIPATYSVTFYTEMPIYDYDEEPPVLLNPECLYAVCENMYIDEAIEFPAIPQKEGYVFTGWKLMNMERLEFINPQPVNMFNGCLYGNYYASWCREDEYEPIIIEISSDKKITKGKEDGAKIILRSDYGFFDDEYSAINWDEVDPADYESLKAKVFSEWDSKWHIVGSDELKVASAERINRKTVELTLSGNSTDIYQSTDIYIEFDSMLLKSEPIEQYDELWFRPDTKIKMDSDGVRAKMYRSDNAITLSRQNKKSSGGGGSSVSRYSVVFDTDGGTDVAKQTVNRNDFVKEPEAPQKEGFVFGGWYSDKDCAVSFDFDTKITKNITLYAKWEIEDKTKDLIIFRVGDTNALVFGEEKEFDVAPLIRDDRAFLPARFVAESLGADVEWDEEKREVIITKDETEIIIVIDSQTAKVNGEEITLDTPAFIGNGRTYTPLRFVAEGLKNSVEWNDGEILIYR